MNLLKSFTPEQLNALSPECLKILLDIDKNNFKNDLEKDTIELKCIVTRVIYDNNYPFDKRAKWEKNNLNIIEKILLKHHEINFYLIYEIHDEKYYNPTNWKLHTEEEIQQILPTGVDINKISFSNGDQPCKFVTYPAYYKKTDSNPSSAYLNSIEYISYTSSNLKLIHPLLLKMATYLVS